MLKVFSAFLASSSIVAAHDVYAATFKNYVSSEGKVVAVLTGRIEPGDADRLSTIIREANSVNKLVSGVRLNSPGGDVAEGLKLIDVVRTAKIATVVPNSATCASACFLAFAAGAEKYVSYSASIGVHGASDGGAETPESSAATIVMARAVKELGTPPAVVGKMVVTPPSEVVWLTPTELRSMGAVMTGRPKQTVSQDQSSVQQLPPNGTSPQADLSSKPPSWKDVVDKSAALSAQQNAGTAQFRRNCQPDLAVCTMAIFFRGSGGIYMMARTSEDTSGVIKQRELCTFNGYGDVRTCVDWDRGTKRIDMKDSKGQWSSVAAP